MNIINIIECVSGACHHPFHQLNTLVWIAPIVLAVGYLKLKIKKS